MLPYHRKSTSWAQSAFRQNWPATQQAFTADPTLPKDVTFADVEAMLNPIVEFLRREKILPLSFPLPSPVAPPG